MANNTSSSIFRIRNTVQETTPVEEGGEKVNLKGQGFGEVASTEKEEESQKVSDSGVREIILTAPVGHAYTEALKHLLNKRDNKTGVIRTEGSMTQLVATGTIVDEPETVEEVGAATSKAYVFVHDGRRMNLGQVEEMVHKLATLKQNNPKIGYVALGIEGMEEVLAKEDTEASVISQELLHLEKHHGVEVYYTRQGLINRMEQFLRV